MVKVRFTSWDGASEREIEAAAGGSLMQAAVAAAVPGIDAICGGSMVYGTCHVYVDEAWFARLPPLSPGEADMLDFGVAPQPNSRLACQIRVTPEFEGLAVTTPEAQQ
jgi:2Fe-2S ferredoxin